VAEPFGTFAALNNQALVSPAGNSSAKDHYVLSEFVVAGCREGRMPFENVEL